MLASLSEEIQKFDTFFNEKSHDLSPYDVRQTQVISVQIKEKFVALQDTLKPKKKFGFKSKYKKVCDHYFAYNKLPAYINGRYSRNNMAYSLLIIFRMHLINQMVLKIKKRKQLRRQLVIYQ